MAHRQSHNLVGDAFLGLVALAVFVGALAFQKGVPAASVVATRPGEQPHAVAQTASNPNISTVAEALIPKVNVYDSETAAAPSKTLDNPQPSGAPLVFLVKQIDNDWLNVYLPVRPNGSTGWIHRADVKLTQHDWRIQVQLTSHQITVYCHISCPNGALPNDIFLQEPIAVGKQDTPTPGGVYYIKELLRPPNPNTVYGPYAYGLSGFSNVLQTFNGGEGVIGIHGNNDASVLGHDVSHGCIRMSNPGIVKLVNVLPLGVPVNIVAT
ncbi:MAG: L,D-transpeptidase [Acidimicrobiia bacterium]|nr:L,D-transpeptidase [Acidimicrobiia bacterium]